MCDGGALELSIASLAIGSASAGVNFAAQYAQAQQQSAMAKANAAAAVKANNAKQAQLASDFWQRRDQIVQDQNLRDIQAEQAQARARVSAGEAGVGGLVLDSVMGDISRQRSEDEAIAQRNLATTALDTENARANANAEALDRARSIPMGITPSFISPILQVGNSAVNSALNYRLLTQKL